MQNKQSAGKHYIQRNKYKSNSRNLAIRKDNGVTFFSIKKNIAIQNPIKYKYPSKMKMK